MIENLNQIKKDVVKDWLRAIPTLKHYSSNKLYRVTGCVVIGLELLRGPWSAEYRPHFVMYPLWKENIKQCMEYPIVMSEFRTKKNLQFNIPYDKHGQYYEEAVESVKKTKPILFNNDVSLDEILTIIDEDAIHSILGLNPKTYLQARLQESKIIIAVCCGKLDLAEQIIKKAHDRTWDADSFKYWNISIDSWLKNVALIPENIESYQAAVKVNSNDKKIIKLNTF